MAGAVVDVLEVVAVEHDEAQRRPLLLGAAELARRARSSSPRRLSRPVSASVWALRRSRSSAIAASSDAAACAASSDASSPWPRSNSLREPARADEQADLVAVRAQRDQHDRAERQAGELRDVHRRSCRATRRRPTRRCARAAPASAPTGRGSGPAPAALHSVDSTSWPSSSSRSSWLVSIGKHAAERAHRDLCDRGRVAQRAHVDEQPCERREVDVREPRSSSIGAASAASERSATAAALPGGRRTLVSMLMTPTTPVGITSGTASSETVARETSTKSGSAVTSSDELRLARCAPRARSRPRRAAGRRGSSRSRGRRPTRAGRARARTPPRRRRRARRGVPRARRRSPPPRCPPTRRRRPPPRTRARSEAGRSQPDSATWRGQWLHPGRIGIPAALS